MKSWSQAPPLKPPLWSTAAGDPTEGLSLEQLRQWYEERAESRLKGQYESTVRGIVELLEDASSAPLRLTALRITAPHTSQAFLDNLLSPYLGSRKTSDSPYSTVRSVLKQTRDVTQALAATSIFTSLQPTLVRSLSPLAETGDVELLVVAKGRSRRFLKGETNVGNSEASGSISGKLFNTLGCGDSLSVVVSTGTRTRRSTEISFDQPLPGWELNTRGEGGLWEYERDWTGWAGCWERQRGAKAGISTRTLLGHHTLAYTLVSRQIHTLAPTASLSTRLAAGTNIKSSFTHTLQNSAPNWSYRLAQEVAGLAGDAKFVRLEADFSRAIPLTTNLSTSFTARTAFIRPLSESPVPLSDRAFLGGPTSVRMFRMNNMGPHDGLDATGGELAASAGLSLLGNFPGRALFWPLQWQLFVNSGTLGRLLPGDDLATAVRTTLSRPSVSVGLGLVGRMDPIRVEFNLGVPLAAAKGEGLARGWSVGIGLEFL
ncbi:mitochondrial protein [Dacryopinax primogenitus]|uniref:Mitochondrial protein n=1 Tax=Dacryopinax primogenitus (strain DJM 731) TaxID=1858805 RepID=M5FUW5_DACPD|nr:mitochondrial protein [Dacryopinax primogenitus]EJT99324.1 mitochondrial protein [Dacryopinax primogenitus]